MENDLKQYEKTAELLKVLAHPLRICIMKGLLEKGECNVSHMQNCLDIPQPTVSQHLAKLKSAGIIEARRDGLEVYYSISNEKAATIIEFLFMTSELPVNSFVTKF